MSRLRPGAQRSKTISLHANYFESPTPLRDAFGMDESIMNFDGSIATESEYQAGGFLAGTQPYNSLNGVGSIATGVSSNGQAQSNGAPTTGSQSTCISATGTCAGSDPNTPCANPVNGDASGSDHPCTPAELSAPPPPASVIVNSDGSAVYGPEVQCGGPCIAASAQQIATQTANMFPDWMGQKYFSPTTCTALTGTAVVGGFWSLANPETLPTIGTVSGVAGLLAWAGCP
jgi:hypothetical protein